MDLRRILWDSMRLLYAEPKAFVPKIITTALYSLATLYSASLASRMLDVGGRAEAYDLISRSLLLLSLLPLLYFIDILSYAMYPRIVSDHREGRRISLAAALADGLRAWKVVLAIGGVIFAFMFAVAAVSIALALASYAADNQLLNVVSIILIFFLIIAFSVVMFFVVPAAVLDGKNVAESFRVSVRLGLKHRTELVKLNLLFAFLTLATILIAFRANFTGTLSSASILLYVVIRLVEAVVYTYLNVANPVAYLHVRINNVGGE